MKKATIIVFLCLGLTLVLAQGSIDVPHQWNGYTRTSLMAAGPRYDFTNAFAEISIQSIIQRDDAILKADLRWRHGLFFDEEQNVFDIKELYVGIRKPFFEITTGYQIVNWGRTDGFNPTDNINPKDYFFLTLHPDDQQQSNLMIKGKLRASNAIELEVIGLPRYRPSVYRYDLLSLDQPVQFLRGISPPVTYNNMGLAARINAEFSGFGASISYFSGFDPFHGFRLHSINWSSGNPAITNEDVYHRKKTYGADLEIPVGPIILRAEAAWNNIQDSGSDAFTPFSDLSYVTALELTSYGTTLLAQFIGKWVPDHKSLIQPVLTDPTNQVAQLEYANKLILFEQLHFNRLLFNQQDKSNHAFSITLLQNMARELVTAELSTYYNLTSDEWMVQPKLSWKYSDSFTITGGAVYMHGPEKSLFDYSSAVLNGIIIECKFSF